MLCRSWSPHFPARALAVSGAALTRHARLPGRLLPSSAGSHRRRRPPTRPHATSQVLAARSATRRAPAPPAPATTARWSGSDQRLQSCRPSNDGLHASLRLRARTSSTGFTGSDEPLRRRAPPRGLVRAATLRAINFVRSMSGLAPVSLHSDAERPLAAHRADDVGQRRAEPHPARAAGAATQQAGAANAGTLEPRAGLPERSPRPAWSSPYMQRPRRRQRRVGHRRWLLNPFATAMGIGLDRHRQRRDRDRPERRRHDRTRRWVSWPSAGYFPNTLEPGGRWSLSAGNKHMDFRRATVRVYRNGEPVARTQVPRGERLRPADAGLAAAGQARPAPAPSTSSSAASGSPGHTRVYGRSLHRADVHAVELSLGAELHAAPARVTTQGERRAWAASPSPRRGGTSTSRSRRRRRRSRSSSTNACSSSASGRWWAIVTCGWYGKAPARSPAARWRTLGGELLALADPLAPRRRRPPARPAGRCRCRAGGSRNGSTWAATSRQVRRSTAGRGLAVVELVRRAAA